MKQQLISLAAGLLANFLGAVTAQAHGHLKSSVPADGSSVAAPGALKLTFTEALELKYSGVKVTGPDKADVAVGPAAMAAGSDTALDVPVTGTLAPGTYAVEWHVLSKDGHKTHGTFTFKVTP